MASRHQRGLVDSLADADGASAFSAASHSSRLDGHVVVGDSEFSDEGLHQLCRTTRRGPEVNLKRARTESASSTRPSASAGDDEIYLCCEASDGSFVRVSSVDETVS